MNIPNKFRSNWPCGLKEDKKTYNVHFDTFELLHSSVYLWSTKTNFLEDHSMNIHNKFASNLPGGFREEDTKQTMPI